MSTTQEGVNEIPITTKSGNSGVNLKTKSNESKNEKIIWLRQRPQEKGLKEME